MSHGLEWVSTSDVLFVRGLYAVWKSQPISRGRGNFLMPNSRSLGATYIIFREELHLSMSLPTWVSDFTCIASFRTAPRMPNFAIFDPPCKKWEGMDEMSPFRQFSL